MANQVIVTDSGNVQVAVSPPANVQVQISRSVIGTVANVASANYANFAGTVTGATQSNITTVGTLGNLTVSNTITTQNLVVTGNLSVGNLVANNANYANFANVAYNVSGSNVSGAVNLANYATVANSVAVANVSGIGNIAITNYDGNGSNILHGNGYWGPEIGPQSVANANYANFAGTAYSVSGSNVSGDVSGANHANIADSANSVAGANVSGEVSYAAVANSVALANVSGAGNIASINLDGNVSNALLGNGSWGPVEVTSTNIANGTSNVSIPVANGPITFSVNGNANIANLDGNASLFLLPKQGGFNNALRIENYGRSGNTGASRIASFRYRGNSTAQTSVQPGDGTMEFLTLAHNGAALQTSSSAAIRGVVDSSYTANGANIPIGWQIQVNDTNGGVNNETKTHNFYSNGSVSLANALSVEGGSIVVSNDGGASPSSIVVQGDGTASSSVYLANAGFTVNWSNVDTSTGYSPFRFDQITSQTADVGVIRNFRARGTSFSNIAAVTANDYVYQQDYGVYGDAGNTYLSIGGSSVVVTDNDGAGNVPANLTFNSGSGLGQLSSNIIFNTGNTYFNSDVTANGLIVGNESLYVENGGNSQVTIRGLDNANSTANPQIVFKASAGNLTNPQPLTTPYGSQMFQLLGQSWNGSQYAFGGAYNMRYIGEPVTPAWYVYGEPVYNYVQPITSGPSQGNTGYFFENHTGGQLFVGAFDIDDGFNATPYNYSFNIALDGSGSNFETFTMTYGGNMNIANCYNGGSANITGNILAGNANLGNLAIANFFSGDGSLLSNINGANVSEVANANYANFAGDVVNSAQSNITSLGNLVSLTINNGNVTLPTTQFNPNGITVGTTANTNLMANSSFVDIDYGNGQGDGNLILGKATTYVKARGNSSTIATASANDRIGRTNYMVYNGTSNVLAVSTHALPTAINSNANAVTTGGQFNIFTGNPNGDQGNANALSNMNTYAFGAGGTLAIQVGAATGSGSYASFSGYGASVGGNGVQSQGVNFARYRGNRDSNLSVQANDQLGVFGFIGYNGSSLYTARTASLQGVVDSAYVTNASVITSGFKLTSVGSSSQNDNWFYANANVRLGLTGGSNTTFQSGATVFVNNLDANANANVAGNLNVTGTISYNTRTFGSFTSNVTQTNSNVGNAIYMTLNNDEGSNGVSIVSSTQITTARIGNYNIQFSAQLEKTDSGTDEVEIWLNKNGSPVANSATRLAQQGNNVKGVAAWNWLVNSANVNDYYQIAWASNDANMRITAIDSANTLSGVAVPSLIVTVVPVGA